MYDNQALVGASTRGLVNEDHPMNRTLRQNIEAKIQAHKKEIAELEDTLSRMPDDFLDMNIGQINKAMSW